MAKRKPAETESPPNTALIPARDADEESYDVCLDSLARRRERLRQLQDELAVLKLELGRFETVCQARVGDLLVEMRRANDAVAKARRELARFLEERGVSRPEILDAMFENLDLDARGYDELWDELDETLGDENVDPARAERVDPSARPPSGSAADELEAAVPASDDLKRVYRELAKRCHPDLAPNPAEHLRREALMLRINAAYDLGDLQTLRGMLLETEADAPGFATRPVEIRLEWARAEIARLDAMVTRARNDLTALRATDLHRMWQRSEAGEPVMEELEDDLERRIRTEGARLDRLIALQRRLTRERDVPVAS